MSYLDESRRTRYAARTVELSDIAHVRTNESGMKTSLEIDTEQPLGDGQKKDGKSGGEELFMAERFLDKERTRSNLDSSEKGESQQRVMLQSTFSRRPRLTVPDEFHLEDMSIRVDKSLE